MSWDLEWKSIENQIHEFDRLCTSYIKTMEVKTGDVYGVLKTIIFPVCNELLSRINLYEDRYGLILSENALGSIKEVRSKFHGHLESTATSKEPSAALYYKETLNRFASNFNYHTQELDGNVRRLSERAFIHLQRTLAVNEIARDLWKDAFTRHETKVEALGAVHLLSHGIWAFKIDSGGQRTDLVYKEKFTNSTYGDIKKASEGLVLTEWKLVQDEKDTDAKAQEAFRQAKIYSLESLAEVELTKIRYLVLVSLIQLRNMPADFDENGTRYRHVNIAIEPGSPSIRSKKK